MSERIAITVNDTPTEVPMGCRVAASVMQAQGPALRQSVTDQARGPLCGMGICFECRAEIDGLKHCRSCQILCVSGMEIRSDEQGS